MSRNPIKSIFNYPPAIIERCDKLGLVDASNKPGGAVFYVKKVTAYALWVVVNWFDALVLGVPAALVAGLIVVVC